MNILDVEQWVTPASKYKEERAGNFRIRRMDYLPGLYILGGIDEHVYYSVKKPIPITRLEECVNGEWHELMVDDPLHSMSMLKYAQASTGNVLVAGLGLGLIAHELVKIKGVETTITVIEESADVCRLVSQYLPTRIELINCDFWDFIKDDKTEWDTILVDIWSVYDIQRQIHPRLTEVLPSYFSLKGKHPNAKLSLCGYPQLSDIKPGEIKREGKWHLYSHQMLRGSMRDYIIDQVKKPLMKAIIVLANRYPEPTRENCINSNSHILLDIQDEFLTYEDHKGRRDLFKAIFRILIGEYEHDPYYHYRFDWF
ncbi:hypothetical protein LCGC14_2452550, partial [marine sediment metagenome]